MSSEASQKQTRKPFPIPARTLLPIVLGLLCLVVCAVMFSGEMWIAQTPGGALDDSWIHYTIAKNLAHGDGWSFNKGISTGGSTAPIYTFIVAIGTFVFGSPIIWSKVIGVVGLFFTAWMTALLAASLWPDRHEIGWIAGAWVILSPSLAWAALSGMEITTYLALALAGLWLVFKERYEWGAALLALSVWARPDGGWLLGIAFLAIPPRKWLIPAAIAAAIVLPYFAFNYAVGGAIFPGTVGTKGGFAFLWSRTSRWIWEFLNLQGVPYRGYEINHPIIWAPLWILGAIVTWRRTWVLTLFVVTFPLVFSLAYPNSSSHARYLMPTIPPAMLLGAAGLHWLTSLVRDTDIRKLVLVVGAGVIFGWTVWYIPAKAETLGWNVQNINKMHVTLGKWVRENTAPDDTIAVNDVGAIGYYSDRFIVDLVGLVTPHMSFWENIDTYHPKYLIIFPDWFREPVESERFRRMYKPTGEITLQRNTVVSRSTMWIFERVE